MLLVLLSSKFNDPQTKSLTNANFSEHNKHDNTSALPGPAPHTAGPHKKDWLNKLDPRVDATGTKHKDHTTGEHSVDHPSHAKGPAALGGPTATAPTTAMHNTGTGHRDESKDPLASSQLGVHSSEHDRAQGATPLVAKAPGTDLGDKLHGTERNRGAGAHTGDLGHHASGEHSTHVGHGHTTGGHGTNTTDGHNPNAAYGSNTNTPSSHHIGGETSSHVGHGHTGHHTGAHEKTNLTDRGHESSGLHGSNQQTGLTGSHQQSGLTGTHQQSGLTDTHESTGLHGSSGTGAHGQSGLSGNNSGLTTESAFPTEDRRGTTSGVHTDPAIHHVPAVGHKSGTGTSQ